MVMFCLMTRRRINLIKLILDFILAAVNAERRNHATFPYGMFLTKAFIRAQLPLDGHKAETKRATTIMKTFSALGLKPQGQEKEKEKEKKKEKEEEKKKDKKKVLLSKKPASRRLYPNILIERRRRKKKEVKEIFHQFLKRREQTRGDC